MKTVMKKCGVLAVTLLAAVTAVTMVTACFDDPASSVYKPPEGMGAVRLNLSLDNPNARATIMPEGATITTFKRFLLDFQPAATPNGAEAFSEYYTYGQLTGTSGSATTPANPIPLSPGNYTLRVIAFMDEGDPVDTIPIATPPEMEAAIATVPLTVTTATSTVEVTLKAYDPAVSTGNGTFAWSITNSISNLTTATMVVTGIGSNINSYPPTDPYYNLRGTTAPNNWVNTAGVSVAAGYYFVDFTLATASITRKFRHVLQIYRGQKSTFTYVFNNDKIGIVSVEVTPDIDYDHPADCPPQILRSPPATPVAVASGGTVTVEIGTNTTILSLANAEDYTYEEDDGAGGTNEIVSIEWYFNGATTPIEGATCPVNTNAAPFNLPAGTYSLTVVGYISEEKAEDLENVYPNAPFSTEIFIKLVEP